MEQYSEIYFKKTSRCKITKYISDLDFTNVTHLNDIIFTRFSDINKYIEKNGEYKQIGVLEKKKKNIYVKKTKMIIKL